MVKGIKASRKTGANRGQTEIKKSNESKQEEHE